jgi:hypothetical protein
MVRAFDDGHADHCSKTVRPVGRVSRLQFKKCYTALPSALPEAKFRAYPGTPDAYNSGPLCVSRSERGRGLAELLFRAARKCLPEREGVAFIRRDNSASRAVHAKNGFREVAGFSHDGIDYLVATNLE